MRLMKPHIKQQFWHCGAARDQAPGVRIAHLAHRWHVGQEWRRGSAGDGQCLQSARVDVLHDEAGSMEGPWFTLRRFSQQYPRIAVHTDLIDHSEALRALREPRFDCVLIPPGSPQDEAADGPGVPCESMTQSDLCASELPIRQAIGDKGR